MSEDSVSASDGLVARPSGPWAEDKLYYVRRYIHAMSTGMKTTWERRAYVDLMSGPGICAVPETGRQFDGSPLIALRARDPFDVVILVEANQENADALTTRAAGDGLRPVPIILTRDCNEIDVLDEIRRDTLRALTLVFVDLLGFNVPFSTIRHLTEKPATMDLVITFPEMNLTRNALLAAVRDESPRWTAFYGTDAWRTHILHWTSKRDRKGESIKWGLTRLYQAQLRTLGYESILVREPMRNLKGAPLYRPLFASRSSHGLKLWRGISALDHTRTNPLF